MFVRCSKWSAALFIVCVLFCIMREEARAQSMAKLFGIFDDEADIGMVKPSGTMKYDLKTGDYTIASAGENIWSTMDGFHFAWKKVSGDVVLTADIGFQAAGADTSPNRKAVLMFRQTLDADGIYADAAQHGSGMTALQYRRAKGATTQDIELSIDAPRRMRLEKRGDTINLFLSKDGEPLHQVGASVKLHLEGEFYAGIGVCAHNQKVVEQATFSNVELRGLAPSSAPVTLALYSTLQTIGIDDNFRQVKVVLSKRGQFEAPNWSRDGKFLVFDESGQVWRIAATGGSAEAIDTGAATKCTGSHGLSPDGKWLAISCAMPGSPETRVYILPLTGGAPRMVTERPASYFHSWSPDGKTILFTRPSQGSLNILSISAEGGAEIPLTQGKGVSDDPDFSADGQYIYFNSDRGGGTMQIWRMHADGSDPEQVTNDELNNWTPHPSPEGRSVVFVSYARDVTGHPANKDVALRILSTADGKTRVLVNLVGGAGTINVPSWAPDGKHLAFVSYQLLPADDAGSSE